MNDLGFLFYVFFLIFALGPFAIYLGVEAFKSNRQFKKYLQMHPESMVGDEEEI